MPDPDGEFYVGYLPLPPSALAGWLRRLAVALLAGAAALGGWLAVTQGRFDAGTFEYGLERSVAGLLLERPYPRLVVLAPPGSPSPGAAAGDPVTYLLVAAGKHGAAALAAGLDGRPVRVTGSLITNGALRMLEAHRVEPLSGAAVGDVTAPAAPAELSLGRLTLDGEIVDSKCHLGVMKPGRGKPHKDCAIRCISGGIPPLLRLEDGAGRTDYLLLVPLPGKAGGRSILDRVAEPVRVTGRVTQQGDLKMIYAEPADILRLAP